MPHEHGELLPIIPIKFSLACLEIFFEFDFVEFLLHSLDILPHQPFRAAFFFGGIAEKVGGVENWKALAAVPFAPNAANLGDFDVFFEEESFDRRGSGQHNQRRINEPNLLHQIGAASSHFVTGGFAVAGGTAFDDVADKYVIFGELNGFEDTIEQLSRLPNKRLPRQVFILTGAFTNDHNFGSGIATTNHRMRPRCAKVTLLTLITIQAHRCHIAVRPNCWSRWQGRSGRGRRSILGIAKQTELCIGHDFPWGQL
jgi:hypothetical protein